MFTFFSSLKRHDSGLATLLTICAISLILSIGYAINFQAILRVILNENPLFEICAITYVASSGWLFILCLFMIAVTLFGVKITLLSTPNRIIICIFFFIGVCGYIMSFLFGLLYEKNSNFDKYIHWQYEFLLYILSPLYLTCLIFFFDNPRFTQIIRLILFSLMLFITPCMNLIYILIKNKNDLPTLTISAYASICIATSILTSFHIICIWKYYNSGLCIKLFIMTLLSYGIIVLIYDNEDHNYRIDYYYSLLIALFIIYSFEIFVPGPKKLVHIDIQDIIQRPSYDPYVEKHVTVSPGAGKGILQFVQKNNKEDVIVEESNPNENINSVIKIFPDFKPCKENKDKYFNDLIIDDDNDKSSIDRVSDSIAAIVPFYNEKASEIHATLRTLYFNFEYIKKKNPIYKFTHFNVLLVGDGWFKADISTKRYLTKLYNIKFDDNDNFNNFNNYEKDKHKFNTVILQTEHGKKLCINPFKNGEEKLYLKVTTIIKIDNRKKANSHEWFLGQYGFAEWCKCDYMFFTDAYSTTSEESLYRCMMHMKQPKNKHVVCCTGRARVYTMKQEIEFQNLVREEHGQEQEEEEKDNNLIFKWWQNDIFKSDDEKQIDILELDSESKYTIEDVKFEHWLTIGSHLRSCQMFEFEALYGTIGCYLLGGFLPVIPGPCGFYRSKYLLLDKVRGWYFEKIDEKTSDSNLIFGNMKLAEDRILTISSILNCDEPVRHSLIPECIFYFDPITDLTQLMKQRRRWLNGSIATVIFILFKVSLSKWNVNIFRRLYVVSMWYMQLFMYCVVALSPPLIFIIAFEYGFRSLLNIMIDNDNNINI